MPQPHAVAKDSPSEDPLTVIGATPRPGNDKLKRTRRHAGGESIATRDERIDPKLASHGGATGVEALCVDVGATDVAEVQCAPGHYELSRPSHRQDRKSTRLNSSHVAISYAVF